MTKLLDLELAPVCGELISAGRRVFRCGKSRGHKADGSDAWAFHRAQENPTIDGLAFVVHWRDGDNLRRERRADGTEVLLAYAAIGGGVP